jgi:hypothetical protein
MDCAGPTMRAARAQLRRGPDVSQRRASRAAKFRMNHGGATPRSAAGQAGASAWGRLGTLLCQGQEQKLWAFTFTLGCSRRLRVHGPPGNPWPCGGMWNSSTWSPLQVLWTVPTSIITAAILDLLHHSRSINIQGESYRLKAAPQGGTGAAASRRGDGRGGIFDRRIGNSSGIDQQKEILGNYLELGSSGGAIRRYQPSSKSGWFRLVN